MARVVCRVVHKPGRITFLWSEGRAAFPPYHLEGSERDRFQETAERARRLLAACAQDPQANQDDLRTVGQELFRAVFRVDAGDSTAAAVAAWWRKLVADGNVETLELVGNAPGRIPWNLVNEDGSLEGFWGLRHDLGVGTRVNPLRSYPWLEGNKPVLALANQGVGSEAQARALRKRAQDLGFTQVATAKGLLEELTGLTPDVLVGVGHLVRGHLSIGEETLAPRHIAQVLAESDEPLAFPLTVLLGWGSAEETGNWECFLAALAGCLPGAVASEVPLPPEIALQAAEAIVAGFVEEKLHLGRVLREVRRKLGPAGWGLAGYAPPTLRIGTPEPEEIERCAPPPQPLPEYPYRPFLPMEREDRSLLVGRDAEVIACAGMLEEADSAGVLVHGRSSTGKTSFLRAGLVPYLEEEALGFLALRDRIPEETGPDQAPPAEGDHPVLALRAGPELVGQLVQSLFAFCARPYEFTAPDGTRGTLPLPDLLGRKPDGASTGIRPGAPGGAEAAISEGKSPPPIPQVDLSSPAGLVAAVQADPRILAEVMDRVTRDLPFDLVVVLDQAEDLFLQEGSRAVRNSLTSLNHLAASAARCRLVLAARTDHVGRLQEALSTGAGNSAWRSFFIPALSKESLEEIALTPAASEPPPGTTEVPFTKFQIAYEDGVARALVEAVVEAAGKSQVGPVALLQVACARMYDRVRSRGDKSIREVDVKELGDLTELLGTGMRDRIMDLQLPLSSANALQNLMERMIRRESDGTLTRTLVREPDLGPLWTGPEADLLSAVQTAAASPVPLLDVQQFLVDGREEIWWSVPNDGLARAVVTREEADQRSRLARTRVIDTLWIMIPLVFLAASLAFFLTRQFGSRAAGETADPAKLDPKLAKALDEGLQEQLELRRWLGYAGHIARAQQAYEAGNALAARQILLSQQPGRVPSLSGEGAGPAEKDLRGFEWYWLWRRLHQEKAALLGHEAPLTGLAVSGDGNLLVSASTDGAVKVWSGKNLTRLTEVPRGKDPVQALALSADGTLLAAGGAEGRVRIWSVSLDGEGKSATLKERPTLQAAKGNVRALLFLKDQGLLLAGTEEGIVQAWNAADGKEKFQGTGKSPVRALAALPGGKVAASGTAAGKVTLWNLETGKETQTFEVPGFGSAGELHSLAIMTDGSLLAAAGSRRQAGSAGGVVRFLDPATGKEKHPPLETDRPVPSLAFLPESRTLALGGMDRLVRLVDLDPNAGPRERRAIPGHYGWVETLAVYPSGEALVSGSRDGTVKVWPLQGATYPEEVRLEGGAIRSLALAPKDGVVACGMESGVVHLVDVRTGETKASIKGEDGAVGSLALTAAGDNWLLAAGTWDDRGKGKIVVWEIVAKEGEAPKAARKHQLDQHQQAITCLAFSPDGKTLASGSNDQKVLLWDVEAGKPRKGPLEHKAAVTSLAFDETGRSLSTGDAVGILRCWDAQEGIPTRPPLLAQTSALDAVAFLETDKLMVTGAANGAAQVLRWDEATKKYGVAVSATGHAQPIRTLAIGPKGAFFVTGSLDRTLKIWESSRERPNLGFGRERVTLTGHAAPVQAAVLSKDGSTLVSADAAGVVRFWRSMTEQQSYAVRRD